ncbi:COBRA-like protein 1 [Triticum dicoccoides]|uniref:COBRA-like protein 1 n=1 Tax=Triticum dicoccoides TaxID=85692 RepID=UPI0018904F14|nr:COBRA-like protein 1 [Triticum dicoccoides]XP_037415236.1 COBRA-like protein 1 [Triticum dicoccoides]
MFEMKAFMFRHKECGAYDPLDPTGNITIRWDVRSWVPDGYVAEVSLFNYQQYRHIQPPRWKLGWVWSKKEVIWYVQGGQATEQGDCSKFKEIIPHSCKVNPEIVDLLPGAPSNRQRANCCKGGVLSSLAQDPANAVASFEVAVGRSGTTTKTLELPVNFTLKAPGPGYTCGPATKLDEPTKFTTPDGRRKTQAHMTWTVTCTYSPFRALRSTCCLSLSAFYSDVAVTCPKCSCGCQDNITKPGICVEGNSLYLGSVMNGQDKNGLAPLVQCTTHMCPIRVHWHVKANYKEYWIAKITVTNFNYRMNYSQWNLVAQHPNFNSLTSITSFNYTALNPYGLINDTALLWGIRHYNDYLLTAGPDGYVQSELLFRKDPSTFTLRAGWAFPRRVYFNGDKCVMPPPDAYPWLPNTSTKSTVSVIVPLVLWILLANPYF